MLLNFLANIFFPPVCVACRRRLRRGVVCGRCYRSIGIRDALSCGQCLVRLPGAGSGRADAAKLCHPEFPFLLGAAGRYENHALKALIHYVKFRAIRDAAMVLAGLVVRYIIRTSADLTGFVVVPIPLSPRRLHVRGYNQAELIARHFADMFCETSAANGRGPMTLPVATDILVRTRHTAPQSATESAAERKENIRGAFVVPDPGTVRGKNILLIDDVTTSGATFLEAALALKAAGAGRIIALAAAKA